MSTPVPSKKQLDFLSWEFGVFFHFGIRAFYKGSSDWDGNVMDLKAFDPKELDCDAWIRAIKQAGATYAVLTCKHHDGFALWPSRMTDYSVAHTPWKDGKGDVVRAFVDACRTHDIKVGLYYSPAQWGHGADFSDEKQYDDYFIGQLSELLTGYGQVDYLWFDGAGSDGHRYDKQRIIREIRALQPNMLIFNMWDPDTRWVGNEDGYADMPNSSLITDPDPGTLLTEERQPGLTVFLPAECDMRMRSTWFDCEDNEDTIKTVDELVGIYEMSVGRGANLLLNIGPDARGLLPDKDALRLRQFGEALRKRYGAPLTAFQFDDGALTAESPVLIDRVMIREDLTQGEKVTAFRVYADLPGGHGRVCVYKGNTIGHKAICVFPTIKTKRVTVETEGADGRQITGMQAFYAGGGV